ncbi:MAG: SDR family oxidoreductase [Candidatus Nanopelagicales bacterium]
MTVPTAPDALSVFAPGCLAGRSAVVTGGGSGIGAATARLLADLGARVNIVGRRPEALALTAEHNPDLIIPATADLREPDQVDAMLATIESCDFLMNNAGGQFVSQAQDITYKGFRAVTRLNLDAPWYLTTRIANRFFIPAGYGKIVSITMTPHRGMPLMAHSSAARAGMESLTRNWAAEWGRLGIRAVALAPGIVHTEAWQRYGLSPEQVSAGLPAGRLQTADEVAAMTAFLFSPAGDYITGTTLTCDGGFDIMGPSLAG